MDKSKVLKKNQFQSLFKAKNWRIPRFGINTMPQQRLILADKLADLLKTKKLNNMLDNQDRIFGFLKENRTTARPKYTRL